MDRKLLSIGPVLRIRDVFIPDPRIFSIPDPTSYVKKGGVAKRKHRYLFLAAYGFWSRF
jgi:hypothetical protein